MKLPLSATSLALCLVVAPAWANEALAKSKNCLSCHQIDAKLIGPAYKDVAAKYAGQSDAPARLAQKVMKGGAGVWGPVPMPANPQVNEAEAKQLVQWILALK
jgi:cytochrome c